jgi:hypothetical protein
MEIERAPEVGVALQQKVKLKVILSLIIFMRLPKRFLSDKKFVKIIKMAIKIENIHSIFVDILFAQQYLLKTFSWIIKMI